MVASTKDNQVSTATPVEKHGRGQHPNSRANLRPKPWQPGQSGNPSGAHPHGPMVTPALRRLAAMPWDEFRRLQPQNMTIAEVAAWRIIMDAIDEDGYQAGTKSRQQMLDRLDGTAGDEKTEITVNTQVVVTKW